MFPEWVGLFLGVGLAALGVRTMNGWQAAGYRRPRMAGWSGVAGGVGFAGLAVVNMTGSSGTALWICFGLMLVSGVLLVRSRPATRFSRRDRG